MVGDFIQRVSAYPLVSATWQRASGCYIWAKESSACARAAAGVTEDGLRIAARTAAPLLGKLEGSIATLDHLACRQLDRLEARCPAVKAPTEEIVESTYGYYSAAVKPKVDLVFAPVASAVSKVQSAKAYSLAQYRRLSDSGEWATWVDGYIEHYLPEDKKGKSPETPEGGTDQKSAAADGARSFGGVGRKLRRRLLSRAASEAAAAREEFAARLEAAETVTAAVAAQADVDAAAKLASAARRAQAMSRAGVEFAAARLPALESLPIAGWVVDWLSDYTSEHFNFDPFYHEDRRFQRALLAPSASADRFSRCNGGPRGPQLHQREEAEDEDDGEDDDDDDDELERLSDSE